jgi:hypothetical protein
MKGVWNFWGFWEIVIIGNYGFVIIKNMMALSLLFEALQSQHQMLQLLLGKTSMLHPSLKQTTHYPMLMNTISDLILCSSHLT